MVLRNSCRGRGYLARWNLQFLSSTELKYFALQKGTTRRLGLRRVPEVNFEYEFRLIQLSVLAPNSRIVDQ